MKKFFGFFLLASLFLASCQKRPYIQGTTYISDLEGRMLYLKIYADGDLRDIDSTRIVHGKFQFT